ncbi:uncharacterized protein LOC144446941 [Glandiceps talaboti]
MKIELMNDIRVAEVCLSKIKTENLKLEKKLKELQELELNCQQQKEFLLKQIEKVPERKDRSHSDRAKLSTGEKKLYDHLYPYVDEICRQQYLLDELNQQLLVAKTNKEKQEILSALETGMKYLSQTEDKESSICVRWYREMRNSMQEVCSGDTSQMNILHYNSKLNEIKTNLNTCYHLVFSTCYHGLCVSVTVKQSVSPSGNSPAGCIFTCDPYIEDIQDRGMEAVKSGCSVITFITDTVWTGVKDLLLLE